MNSRFKLPRYTPSSWYWIIKDTGTIYSSFERTMISSTDIRFIEWCTTNTPTSIPSMAELLDVLRAQAPDCLPITSVPEKVTPRQAFLALLNQGITEQNLIDAINTSLPESQRSQALIVLQKSNEFQRTNPFISILGSLVGLSNEDIDQLFITAATL